MGKNGIEAMLGYMKARVKLYAHCKLLKGWFTLKILRRYESVVSGPGHTFRCKETKDTLAK